jgi:phosphohistidine phosphatase
MKRLAILRHAKSSWDDANVDDFNRPLNERGWKAARRMGRELKRRNMRFDLVIASTAARVRETLDGLQEKYDFAAPIRFEPEMYGASAEVLLSLIRALPEKVDAPLFVGHNPGLERLIVELTRDDEHGLRRRISTGLPTGALTVMDMLGEGWASVAPGNGKIVELILPKELA